MTEGWDFFVSQKAWRCRNRRAIAPEGREGSWQKCREVWWGGPESSLEEIPRVFLVVLSGGFLVQAEGVW